MMIPVQVKEIAFDLSLSPVVLLIDQKENRALPIWVGPLEAQSIAMALQDLSTPRPMTHDLMKTVCENLGASVRSVEINDIHDGTYYAKLYIQTQSGECVLDSRPSDAIALALRTGSPIYISEKVAEHTLSVEELIDEDNQQELRRILGLNNPEDIKKSLH
ncbi:MAG: bifunctional nuclease family protein [Syntrophaceticus sp.]|nr:bifunctional nuclease family protein [Syntrophaceticus sp.]MDD3315428.1 bifunctional nuclease family protein [Syntrophaceticus sp.]MDD4358951.1 bifunctional nuclease family protein [Syntrophaceticus sp.]MDD4782551.1 bifunctional nuclease family protein [Syntrophaceticus sp.]